MTKKIEAKYTGMPELREGFWRAGRWVKGKWERDPKSSLPMPRARTNAWRGKGLFLAALSRVEAGHAIQKFYKGSSTCRLCGKNMGSGTFFAGSPPWEWPQGLRHYVTEHNVEPSLAFREFITRQTVE